MELEFEFELELELELEFEFEFELELELGVGHIQLIGVPMKQLIVVQTLFKQHPSGSGAQSVLNSQEFGLEEEEEGGCEEDEELEESGVEVAEEDDGAGHVSPSEHSSEPAPRTSIQSPRGGGELLLEEGGGEDEDVEDGGGEEELDDVAPAIHIAHCLQNGVDGEQPKFTPGFEELPNDVTSHISPGSTVRFPQRFSQSTKPKLGSYSPRGQSAGQT